MQALRLHDNPALIEAIKDAEALYPIFILDPHFQDPSKVGPNRMQFLLDSLTDLDSNLRSRGSRLLVIQGTPDKVLPDVFNKWNVTKLCFEYDTEPYALRRDEAARQAAQDANVAVYSPVGHTLYDPNMLIRRAGGKAPLTMKAFEKLVDAVGDPPLPLSDPPKVFPSIPSDAIFCSPDESLVPATLQDLPIYCSAYHNKMGSMPTSKISALSATTPFRGGESRGLQRMEEYLADESWVAGFEKPKGNPATFQPRPATTVLSPYLKFGCLSARLFHSRLLDIYARCKGQYTKPPVSLRGQLLWREFFYCASASVANFDKMQGNPICKQIDWDDNKDFLKAWEESRTGFPWIDAIMTQLRTEGWMHHLARHSVACFLTRGDLYCSWEKGRDVFDKYLVDADWALNNANWMWLSASAFFSQYFRVYSPVSFGKQYDKNGDYIRKYVPILKDMPAKYIYEPWTAPLDVQRAAGCIVGTDYPMPIVDHAVIVKQNMERMKRCYSSSGGGGGGGKNKDGQGKRGGGDDGGKKDKEGSTKKQKTLI